jgi:hypothetical protein
VRRRPIFLALTESVTLSRPIVASWSRGLRRHAGLIEDAGADLRTRPHGAYVGAPPRSTSDDQRPRGSTISGTTVRVPLAAPPARTDPLPPRGRAPTPTRRPPSARPGPPPSLAQCESSHCRGRQSLPRGIGDKWVQNAAPLRPAAEVRITAPPPRPGSEKLRTATPRPGMRRARCARRSSGRDLGRRGRARPCPIQALQRQVRTRRFEQLQTWLRANPR